jgi:hypothetical protein
MVSGYLKQRGRRQTESCVVPTLNPALPPSQPERFPTCALPLSNVQFSQLLQVGVFCAPNSCFCRLGRKNLPPEGCEYSRSPNSLIFSQLLPWVVFRTAQAVQGCLSSCKRPQPLANCELSAEFQFPVSLRSCAP